AGRGPPRPPELAADRAADAEGLDRPEDRRRARDGGDVAVAPGAARGGADEPGAPGAVGGLASQLPAGRAVRRRRGAHARARGAAAEELPADERQPARE